MSALVCDEKRQFENKKKQKKTRIAIPASSFATIHRM
jgi:hypothetical protein